MVNRNVRGGVPSPYPRFIFHGLRSAQLVSSIVVSGIMAYFMHFLRLENFAIPWTFILLLTVSILTIIALTITIVFYNFTYLSPRFNLLLNGGLSLLWALGMALLTWSISSSQLLAKQCAEKFWGGSDAAVGVCRDYKALWSMTVVGTASTFAALALDFLTHRKTVRRGVYVLPEDDKDAQKLNELKTRDVRVAGYEAPQEQGVPVWGADADGDIGYHNRYGAEDDGPLGEGHTGATERRVGYRD